MFNSDVNAGVKRYHLHYYYKHDRVCNEKGRPVKSLGKLPQIRGPEVGSFGTKGRQTMMILCSGKQERAAG